MLNKYSKKGESPALLVYESIRDNNVEKLYKLLDSNPKFLKVGSEHLELLKKYIKVIILTVESKKISYNRAFNLLLINCPISAILSSTDIDYCEIFSKKKFILSLCLQLKSSIRKI